jgi:hypothetical protein
MDYYQFEYYHKKFLYEIHLNKKKFYLEKNESLTNQHDQVYKSLHIDLNQFLL